VQSKVIASVNITASTFEILNQDKTPIDASPTGFGATYVETLANHAALQFAVVQEKKVTYTSCTGGHMMLVGGKSILLFSRTTFEAATRRQGRQPWLELQFAVEKNCASSSPLHCSYIPT
jgi:hypothetical protein